MTNTNQVIEDLSWPDEQMSRDERRAAFGHVVRAHRERHGISLVGLSQATRISVAFLEAIESGQVEKLPGQVFGRGFLRSICAIIRVSPEPFLEAFDLCWDGDALVTQAKIAKGKTTESKPAAKKAIRKQASQKQPLRLPKIRWDIAAGVAVVALAVGISFYIENQTPDLALKATSASVQEAAIAPKKEPAAKLIKKKAAKLETPATAPVDAAEKSDSGTSTANPELESPQQGSAVQNDTPVTASSAKFEQILELQVKEPVRIRIATDDEGSVVKELKPDVYRYRFEQSADLLIYDAGALDVSFNGRSLGSLGSKGRVRRLNFEAKPTETAVY